MHEPLQNLSLRNEIFQIYDEGIRAKAQFVCLCGYNPIFSRYFVLKFGVKGRDFIRFGYGLVEKWAKSAVFWLISPKKP